MQPITITYIASKLGWRVYDGSQFSWHCYGENCRYIDFKCRDDDCHTWGVSVIFDTATLHIREITGHGSIWSLTENDPWKWHDPQFREAYLEECESRKIMPDVAYDHVTYHVVADEYELVKLLDMIAACDQ
jgi:hypothetical protein